MANFINCIRAFNHIKNSIHENYNKNSRATSRVNCLKGEKQRFKDHLCPRLQGIDASGESVRVRYRPARVPRS
jgi:hypothetical protein